MDEDLHDIEDLFFEALDVNEEKVSPNVWDGVEKRLDKDNIISIKKKYITLKRVAILLLLLLGISIYEMDKVYNNNNLAKNGKPDQENQKNSKPNIDKVNNAKTENTLGTVVEPRNNDNAIKRNNPLPDSTNESQIIANNQKDLAIHNQLLHKENTATITHSQKDISKDLAISKFSKKGRLTSKPFYKIKIENANVAEDQQLTEQNNSALLFYHIPFLQQQKDISIENAMVQSKDSIDINKSLQPVMAPAVKTFDTNIHAIANTTKKKSEKISRFSITPFFSPDIAWYHLQDDNTNNNQSSNALDIEAEEKHEFSSTYGALADYKINNHWGLQSGLTLSNININTEPEIIYAQPDNTGNIKYRINTSSGYGFILPSYSANPAIGDSLYAFTSTHLLRYIGIPIAATYNIAKSKFTFSAKAGASINFLTQGKIETTVEKGFDNSTETINSIQGLKKLYFSGLAAIGVDYKLTKRMSLAFTPTIRFALNSINKNTIVKSYPLSFGSSIGLKIGL